jgi:hypothetical protein
MDQFENSLKELSLEGIILIQGLLAQRALELLTQTKKDTPKDVILKPERRVIL